MHIHAISYSVCLWSIWRQFEGCWIQSGLFCGLNELFHSGSHGKRTEYDCSEHFDRVLEPDRFLHSSITPGVACRPENTETRQQLNSGGTVRRRGRRRGQQPGTSLPRRARWPTTSSNRKAWPPCSRWRERSSRLNIPSGQNPVSRYLSLECRTSPLDISPLGHIPPDISPDRSISLPPRTFPPRLWKRTFENWRLTCTPDPNRPRRLEIFENWH